MLLALTEYARVIVVCDSKLIYGGRGGGQTLVLKMNAVVTDRSPCATKTLNASAHARASLVFRIKENLSLTFPNMPSVPFNNCTSSVRVTPHSGQLAV